VLFIDIISPRPLWTSHWVRCVLYTLFTFPASGFFLHSHLVAHPHSYTCPSTTRSLHAALHCISFHTHTYTHTSTHIFYFYTHTHCTHTSPSALFPQTFHELRAHTATCLRSCHVLLLSTPVVRHLPPAYRNNSAYINAIPIILLSPADDIRQTRMPGFSPPLLNLLFTTVANMYSSPRYMPHDSCVGFFLCLDANSCGE